MKNTSIKNEKMQHSKFMQYALDLAKKGAGRVSPNPMVGAVIVKSGKIIGQGYHKKYGSHHAEVNALRQAGPKAKGATLYVTLEPCSHYGKTPPCVDAVIGAGIKHVVMAMTDPNPLVNGRSVRKLRKAKIIVTTGVCHKEAKDLNRAFIKYIKEKSPYVICKVGQSIDGMITTKRGEQGWVTGEKAKKYVQGLRAQVDAIVVGDETVRIDDPKLNVRDQKKPQPKRIILDPFLNTDPESQIFKVSGGEVVLMSSLKEADKKVKKYRNKGIQVITEIPTKGKKMQLSSVIKKMYKSGIQSILVEGGAEVFQSFMKTKLVDEWHIIVAPKVIGDEGLLWYEGAQQKLSKLKIKSSQSLGEDELFICRSC